MADIFTNYSSFPPSHHLTRSMDADAANAGGVFTKRAPPIYTLPDFVFPARAETPSTQESDSQQNTPSNSQSKARSGPTPLPAFTFNPGGAASPKPFDALVSATAHSVATPTKGGRHRRTPSELIGGGSHGVAPRMRSVSPQKKEDIGVTLPRLESSPATPVRGHRHRRSDALSVHEPNTLSKPRFFPQEALASENVSSTYGLPQDDETSPPSTASSPGFAQNFDGRGLNARSQRPLRSPGRARVGFSDKTEIIPRRPLSTISSGTESSISTIKRLSIADSISSITSGPNELSKAARSPLATTFEDDFNQIRPFSADLAKPLDHGARRTSNDELSSTPKTTPQNLRKFPSWNSLKLSRKGKAPELSLLETSPVIVPAHQNLAIALPLDFAVTDAELSENFEDNPTSATVSEFPAFVFPSSCPTSSSTKVHEWMRNDSRDNDGPMIDLDAALDLTGADTRSSQRRQFSTPRQNMHSQARFSGVSNSGLQHHRRTESAPQLVYSGAERPLIRRLNSNSTADENRRFEMENVSEEDETLEDGVKPADSSVNHGNSLLAQSLVAENQSSRLSGSTSRSEAGLTAYTSPNPHSPPSVTVVDADDVRIVGEEDMLGENVYLTRSDSTITSPEIKRNMSAEGSGVIAQTPSQPSTSPIHVTYHESGPASECSVSTTGMNSTRVISNKISFTEGYKVKRPSGGSESYRNDQRPSVDDVPSLIGSGSTMTSYVRQASMSSPSLLAAAAAPSVGSAPSVKSETQHGRRNRSSMASLSKLMGNSFGSKSALSVSTVPEHESTGKAAKKEKRASRLGRLFRFWRAKPSEAA